MKLNSRQLLQLQQALLHGFDRDSLRIMVRLQLDENLDAVAGNDDLTTVVFNLITWAERTNRVGDLVQGALAANPTSAELQQLAADYADWQTAAVAAAPAGIPIDLPPVQAPPEEARRMNWAPAAIAGVVVLALIALALLWPLLFAPDPIGPAPVNPTLPPVESPLVAGEATTTVNPTADETPTSAASTTVVSESSATPTSSPPATESPAPSPTLTPPATATGTSTPDPSKTATPTLEPTRQPQLTLLPQLTLRPQVTLPPQLTPQPRQTPRAPALRISEQLAAFDEDSRMLTIPGGDSLTLEMRDLWSAPAGTAVDCTNGVLVVSWQVRDPFPGGSELEIWRVRPRGLTEQLARGARGNATAGYCDELILNNQASVDYRVEWRFASAVYQ